MPAEEVLAAQTSQGGELFPGVDQYRRITLPAGTKLAKLEPSSSGFFIPYEDFQRCKGDASAVSTGVQVAPRRQFLPNGQRLYDYRPEVSVWIVKKPIEAAAGTTLANPQYGKGGLQQVHIRGYIAGNHDQQERLGLRFSHSEPLHNQKLPLDRGDQIYRQLAHQQTTRNYFCYLDQKREIETLTPTLTLSQQQKQCQAINRHIDEKAALLRQDLIQQHRQLASDPLIQTARPTISPSYRDKIIALEFGTITPCQAEEIKVLRENLMNKVRDTVGQVVRGELPYEQRNQEIHVDELRKAYECHRFVGYNRCLVRIRDNNERQSQVERQLARIDNREKELLRLGKLMHVLQEKQPLAEKAEGKIFFRGSFSARHADDLREHQQARSELNRCGISAPDDLLRQRDEFNRLQLPQRESLRQELSDLGEQARSLRSELGRHDHQRREFNRFLSMGHCALAPHLFSASLSMNR